MILLKKPQTHTNTLTVHHITIHERKKKTKQKTNNMAKERKQQSTTTHEHTYKHNACTYNEQTSGIYSMKF